MCLHLRQDLAVGQVSHNFEVDKVCARSIVGDRESGDAFECDDARIRFDVPAPD